MTRRSILGSIRGCIFYTLGSVAISGSMALAQDQTQTRPTYNLYGTPGLIEMPTAQSAPDAELGFSFSYAGKTLRNSMTFQLTPRLSGTFRYTKINEWSSAPGAPYNGNTYDRSFDLRYRFLDEGRYRPALAVGLQDFIGTGIFSGEYVVASKTLGPVVATAGLGWGRFGSYKGFSNPLRALDAKFETRPTGISGLGGQLEANEWFRGDAALFGGLSWAINDRLTAKLEYSSDANLAETSRGHFIRKSPLNLGLDYRLGKRTQLSLYSLYGSDFGVMFSLASDPKNSPAGHSLETAPIPVLTRAPGAAADLGWATNTQATGDVLLKGLAPEMAKVGLVLEGVSIGAHSATVRIRNTQYGAQAQAVGRTARILSNVLPASVEEINVVPMVNGLAGSVVVINRTALERSELAFDGGAQMLATTQVQDGAGVARRDNLNTDLYPKFTWRLGPYAQASLFDPDSPLRVEAGLEIAAEWNPTPGLYFSGAARKSLIGNLGTSTRASDSVLEHVRSDANIYDREGDPGLEYLTAAYFFRPGRNLYGRVTAGYLEQMYGGVSGEVLWKPVGSRLALGVEINAVKQRSFDMGLGFSPRAVDATNPMLQPLSTYPIKSYETVTGHVSAYYELANGFHGQLDVGKYLAGDWGATIAIDREFENGWKVGAYATFTDVPTADFGEGSFDKGIRITIPMAWQLGQPSRKVSETVLQPLTRDGGAKLNVEDRLYGLVRDTHKPALEARWGRFWR